MSDRAPTEPEHSREARRAVLASSLVAVAALGATTGIWVVSLAAAGATVWGHQVSWKGHERARTRGGQSVAAILIAVAMVVMLTEIVGRLSLGDIPQATFAVVALSITSFDLKTRRNLFSHLFHSLIILYIASFFAWGDWFIVAVIGWGLCFGYFLMATRRAAGTATRRPVSAVRPRRHLRLAAAWLCIAVVVFIAMPEFAGRPFAVPLVASIQSSAGTPVVPGFLSLVGSSSNDSGSFNLRVRGPLSNEVVFHVRSSAPSYWRQQVLDAYDAQTSTWSSSDMEWNDVGGVSTNLQIADDPPQPGTGTITQTFFIERPIGGHLIMAAPVSEIYYPATTLSFTETGDLISSTSVGAGVNYGVVSRVRDRSPDTLRQEDAVAGDVAARYFDPGRLSGRTLALAAQLVAGQRTEYDRVRAVVDYLSRTYAYDLNSPVPGPGEDALDRFLFVDKVGFCEQFATALALLLRTEGIPTRVAIGYATGDHDLLSGTYTVRNSDAHAWVEVYFPTAGWVTFDATPGADVSGGASSPWLFGDPSHLISMGGVPYGAPIAGGGILFAGFACLLVLVARRRWAERRLPPPERAYVQAMRWLRRARLPGRRPAMTVAEHLAALEECAPDVAVQFRPIAVALQASLYSGDEGTPCEAPDVAPLARAAMRHRAAAPRR